MKSFNSHLEERILEKNSHLCVGLDIAVESFPGVDPDLDFLKAHAKKVIDATRELAVAYKPNLGFFERWGSKGFEWLEETLDYIGNEHILVADAKRGDIGNTAKQYAKSVFDYFGFDAVTVNPYMGSDAIRPFISQPEKGAFILCRTSNPSAGELQDQETPSGLLYENVAQCAVQLNENDNVGLVIGATVPQEIQHIRELAPDLPFLLPGIGAQGGDLEKSMRYGNSNGIALINISRGICFAGDLSENAIRKVTKKYVTQMRGIGNDN